MPNLRSKTWTITTPANVGDAQFWEDHLISDTDIGKINSAIQTVENTYPDDAANVNVFPSGGLQGQVLTKTADGQGHLSWLDPASSGHVIENSFGTDMPYQGTMQFLNAAVSNDEENGKTVVDCHGERGDDGKSAYQYAIDGGYTGSETQFTEDLGNFQTYATTAEEAATEADSAVDEIRSTLAVPTFTVDFTTGDLMYDLDAVYSFQTDPSDGCLYWEVIS